MTEKGFLPRSVPFVSSETGTALSGCSISLLLLPSHSTAPPMVNFDAAAPTHFLLSRCFSRLHHLIYQKQLCWPATHSTHLFSVVRLLYVTPINLITLYHPKASLLSLFTSLSPIIFCRLFAWAFHRNSATQHMAVCGGLLWTASISYFDYNSLVEGLSPPSFQGLPSLPKALFRQKGRLTKTLTSKQCQFSCSLMQTSLMPSLIKGEGKTFSRSHGDHTYLLIYPPSTFLHLHSALRWHFPPASFT